MIEIVRLREDHAELLNIFFEHINTPEYRKDFSPFPFDGKQATVLCNYQGQDLYYAIIMENTKIIGFGMLRGWDEGYEIPSIGLCIRKTYQGMGFGKLMLAFLEIASKVKGCSKVMLKVKKNNDKAKRLYEANGYTFKEHNSEYLTGYKDITVC